MRITRWGEYGILSCLYLARKFAAEPIGAAEISQAHAIPLQYTQQILHRLRKGAIIKSARGPHGGFSLTNEPAETSLKEILQAAEGRTFEVICESDPIYPEECLSKVDCGLKHVWHELKVAVDRLLDSYTLEQLLKLESAQSEQLVPGPRQAQLN